MAAILLGLNVLNADGLVITFRPSFATILTSMVSSLHKFLFVLR